MKSKTTKPKIQEIDIAMGMFDFTVVFLTGDYKTAIKRIGKIHDRKIEPDERAPRGCCIWKDGYHPVVWLPRRPRTHEDYSVLAHECIHAVSKMFRWCGMDMNPETEEVLTHGVGHLVKTYLDKAHL